MRARVLRASAISLAAILAALGGAELLFRLSSSPATRRELGALRSHLLTGAMRDYEARAYTVFQRPRPGALGNTHGFADVEWQRAPLAGVPRVLCLGGSTTEGGNAAGRPGAYPRLLELELERRSGRDVEVLNAGIAGWSSAEILVSWFLTLQDFRPDVVVLHEAVNDVDARFSSDFLPDYSHWRRPIQTEPARGLARLLAQSSDLYLHWRRRSGGPFDIRTVSTHPAVRPEPLMAEGRLPHATSLPFRRNVASVARSALAGGATVVLMTLPTSARDVGAFWDHGIAENNQHLRELADELGLVLVDAARAFAARPEAQDWFIDKVHLEVPGNAFKAELVAEGLAPWLAALPAEGARAPEDGQGLAGEPPAPRAGRVRRRGGSAAGSGPAQAAPQRGPNQARSQRRTAPGARRSSPGS